MKHRLLLFCCLFTTTTYAQLPDSLQQHLDSALYIMRQHSLYADRVDWTKAATEAKALAAGAKTKEQLFVPIRHVYTMLNDKHGLFSQYDDMFRLTDSSAVERLTQNIRDEWARGWRIKTAVLGRVAYLRVPGMHVNSPKLIVQYANWLLDSLYSLAAQQPEAWIIDLRMNSGGNILPMMSALASFFEDGPLSFAVDRYAKTVGSASIKKGVFYQDDTVRIDLNKPALAALRGQQVAVLIGAGTGSSGEITALHFKERKKTRLFGERTAGVANATEGFLFNSNQSYFLLTTSHMANKRKQRQPDNVLPHVEVVNNDNFTDLRNDNAVKAALRWLKRD